MTEPRISVVMSTFNGAKFLKESVESVLRQKLADFELLISDDASCDGSYDLVRRYKDDRIFLTSNRRNRGLFCSLNKLLRKTRAPLIKLWSQDDVMLPDCLEKGLEFYLAHSQVGCFYANCDYIDQEGRLVQSALADSTPIILTVEEADRYAFIHGCLSSNISSLFFPKWVFDTVGLFKERCISGDFEMMVRIQEKYQIGRIPDVLLQVRRHARQWSRQSGTFAMYVRDGINILEILRDRLTYKHKSLSSHETQKIFYRKCARNYFHGAVVCLCKGHFGEALKTLKYLNHVFPWWKLAYRWFLDLPGRFMPRRMRRRYA